jgi:hypothetical protein
MQAGYTFDTHEFVKAFINCKTDEEKAEILVKTFATVKNESSQIIEEKFDKAKDELSTKQDVLLVKQDVLLVKQEILLEMQTLKSDILIKMYLSIGGMSVFIIATLIGILPFILKH